jgi:hypothetical protein
MVRMPAGHLPSPPMEATRLFPEPAAGEPYTILIMLVTLSRSSTHYSVTKQNNNKRFIGPRPSPKTSKLKLPEFTENCVNLWVRVLTPTSPYGLTPKRGGTNADNTIIQ